MAKIISIFNHKGGVAKTTTTINLGAALTTKNKKVLLVDMDAQANTTSGVGINDENLELTIYDLLTSKKFKKERILKVTQETQYENLYILPSDITLSNAEITLSSAMSRENILHKILKQIKDEFDYILIDCPPSLGLLSINSLVASDNLIIPVSTSYFSIKGIKHLIETYNLVKENLRENLDIMGVLITMYDSRKNISKDIKESLESVFGEKVFNTLIRINSQIEYAQDKQTPIIYFNKNCNGYIDYMNLADEVISYE
ncbi:ParA family protein [Tepidibacter formicigenes]|uniref:Sporulation initiation inhibitor protein Soj n=1 Tax=Tepidibacter formicigenes DSM 15518 TaxID=1123349 RepID=A0A1M6UER9_9FIRM|nr:AAA family ATPase [Tepidibacter formicigenes]SHK67651.1 chromosome partitioning protein [Tepidibacter formicigenes DSM 15518]